MAAPAPAPVLPGLTPLPPASPNPMQRAAPVELALRTARLVRAWARGGRPGHPERCGG